MQYAPLSTINLLFEHGGLADRGDLVHYASKRRLEDTVTVLQLLLEKGAPADNILFEDVPSLLCVTMFHGTPLWNCCCSGDTEAVRLLLRYGANPRKKLVYLDGCPLEAAQKHGHQEVVDILLDAMEKSLPSKL